MIEAPVEAPEASSVILERDEAWRIQGCTRWLLVGFGAGFALVFVDTASQMAGRDYGLVDVPHLLEMNLIIAPVVGIVVGLVGLILTRRRGPGMWRRLQFRTRTLVIVVACLAFLLGASLSSGRLRNAAEQYEQKVNSYVGLPETYRKVGLECKADAELRRQNVAGLRAGKIPAGLITIQREFLRSLEEDPKVTPAYRQYRRDLITDGEEQLRIQQEVSTITLSKIAKYYENLAAKYERARLRPWLPVEPDPPVPGSDP